MNLLSTVRRRFVVPFIYTFCAVAVSSINISAQSEHVGTRSSDTRPITFEVFSMRPSAKGAYTVRPTITPDGFSTTANLYTLVQWAYNPQPAQYWNSVRHLPSWAVQPYDINARVADKDVPTWKSQGEYLTDISRGALQAALKDRCNLTVKVSQIEVPYFDLVVGKHGPHLTASPPDDVTQIRRGSVLGKGFYHDTTGKRHFVEVSMKDFAQYLMRISRGNLIQDKTGLDGLYDFALPIPDPADPSDHEFGSPLDRLPLKTIGLTLTPGKGPSFIIDVRSISRPSPN